MKQGIASRNNKFIAYRPVLFLFPILLLLAACSSSQVVMPDSDSLRAEAEQALDEGDLPVALARLRQAYNADKENLSTLRLMARFYSTSNSSNDQRQVLQQLLTLDPSNAYALEQMGILELEAGRLDNAQEFLQLALAIDPLRWMALNGLGVIADTQERFAQAEGHFLSALSIVPGHPKLLANLGWSKLLAGDLAEAEKRLLESLQAEPDSVATRSNLAFCFAMQGRYEEALTLYEVLYDESTAANNVGYAALTRGDLTAARSFFDTAIELNPTFYRKAANNRSQIK